MSWCTHPWVYPAWGSVYFLDLVDYFLSHVREISSLQLMSSSIFLGSFLSSPSGTPIMRILVHLMLSQRSLMLSSFFVCFYSFFYILFSGSISIILSPRSFIHSSASVILLLIPSSVLFISICSLVLLGLWQTFLVPSPLSSRDLGSSSLPLF